MPWRRFSEPWRRTMGLTGLHFIHRLRSTAMPPTEPYIDAHCHIWTPDVAHYPLGPGFTVEDMKPKSFTAEELLALCRPAGVGRVNLIQMSFYVGSGQSSEIVHGFDKLLTI
jgi:hypothetical protein